MQPIILIITYLNNSRHLKKIINELLFRGLAKSINKINYGKSYHLIEGKIIMKKNQLLIIHSYDEKKELIVKMLEQNQDIEKESIIIINKQI